MKKETPYPIFQIGFNKCGTTSLHDFFVKNGYLSHHWDGGNIARTIKENIDSQNILKGYPENSFFSDMESSSVSEDIFGQYYFQKLNECYRSARFILNIRDKNKWIKSRLNHRHHTDDRRWKFGEYNLPAYAKDSMFRLGDLLNINFRKDKGSNSSDGPELLKKIWSAQWDSHIYEVTNYFKKIEPWKLLVFDVEKDNIYKLIDFFKDLNLNKERWGISNKT